LDALLERAAADHWSARWKAVTEIAAQPAGDGVFRLRALLLRDPRPRVREAIAWACMLRPELGSATLLGIALKKDRDPAVRRAAAIALVHHKDRRAVTALVEALATERDPRTRLQIVATLRALTPAPCLMSPKRWKSWWQANAHDPRFAPADEQPRRATYDGVPLETRTVARIPGPGKRLEPRHVLVLPAFGWSAASFGPYLLPLRARAAITWVRLPSVQQLTGRSGYGTDLPVYPVGRLVKALEAFRRARRIDRFIVLAQGASGWIAMRYALAYKRRCAGLILIDTALDKQAYAASLARGAARGTKTERWIANTLMGRNSVRLTPATLDRLQALNLEAGFQDPADLEIAWMFATAREPQGFATVPEIAWARHKTLEIPALFLYSAASVFSGHRDADRIRDHFPNSLVAPLKETRGLPYVERNPDFFRVIDAFFARMLEVK